MIFEKKTLRILLLFGLVISTIQISITSEGIDISDDIED